MSTSYEFAYRFACLVMANRKPILAAYHEVAGRVKAAYRHLSVYTAHGKTHAMYVRSADVTVLIVLNAGDSPGKVSTRTVVVPGNALDGIKTVLDLRAGAAVDAKLIDDSDPVSLPVDRSNARLIICLEQYLPSSVVSMAIHAEKSNGCFRRWWVPTDCEKERVDAMYIPDLDHTWACVQKAGATHLVALEGFHLERLDVVYAGHGHVHVHADSLVDVAIA